MRLILSPPDLGHSHASLKRWAKAKSPEALKALWQTTAPQAYRNLGITTPPSRCPKELRLSRSCLGRLLAARTGHGDFASYHERFNHQDACLLCSCGDRKTPLHFFFCRKAHQLVPRLSGAPSIAIPDLLGTTKGAMDLAAWLTKTRFFEDVCPRQLALS
jgi:hypothetical protein